MIDGAFAVAIASAGADVCCIGRTESDLVGAVAEIQNDGGTATFVQADVTDFDSVGQAFCITVGEFGGIDIVVINAGGSLDHSANVESGSPEQWTGTVELRLIGSNHTARAAIPHLK